MKTNSSGGPQMNGSNTLAKINSVIFTSRGPTPLKLWDIVGPKYLQSLSTGGGNFSQPQLNEPNSCGPEISNVESNCTDDSKYSIQPKSVKVQIGADVKRQPWSAHIEKVYDEDLRCFCFELWGSGVNISSPSQSLYPQPITTPAAQQQSSSNYAPATMAVTTPRSPRLSLNISHNCLLIMIKYLGESFSIELSIKDSQGTVRRIRLATKSLRKKNSQFCCSFILSTRDDNPMQEPSLPLGWTLIQADLHHLTRDAFSQKFVELVGVAVHASLRLKVIVAADTLPPNNTLLSVLGLKHWPEGASDPPLLTVNAGMLNQNMTPLSGRQHKDNEIRKPASAGRENQAPVDLNRDSEGSSHSRTDDETADYLCGSDGAQAHCNASALHQHSPFSSIPCHNGAIHGMPTDYDMDQKLHNGYEPCGRRRSHSAIYENSCSPLKRCSPFAFILSESSLAALDLAEPLPHIVQCSLSRPSSNTPTPTPLSDTDSETLTSASREFRPSLPTLPEYEVSSSQQCENHTLSAIYSPTNMGNSACVMVQMSRRLIASGQGESAATTLNALTASEFCTPRNSDYENSGTLLSSSTVDTSVRSDSHCERKHRQSLTARLLLKAKLHMQFSTSDRRLSVSPRHRGFPHDSAVPINTFPIEASFQRNMLDQGVNTEAWI